MNIPEADYVGHMSSPTVGQRLALNQIVADALRVTTPNAVLVVGCSNGNGLEHVDPTITARVTGVDINPAYLQGLVDRFARPGFALDVQCADLNVFEFEREAYDLVHAAPVFEYVSWQRLLPRLAAAMKLQGMLTVVLQRPSASSQRSLLPRSPASVGWNLYSISSTPTQSRRERALRGCSCANA
jgi:cyclopropane fatty-acyl-phospholipid synthase-like methyltransferase